MTLIKSPARRSPNFKTIWILDGKPHSHLDWPNTIIAIGLVNTQFNGIHNLIIVNYSYNMQWRSYSGALAPPSASVAPPSGSQLIT